MTTNAAADGSDHNPACSGDSPATSCRYCAKNRKSPTITKNAMRFTASAAANCRFANSRTSIIGSAERRWRRTHAAPTSPPTTTATSAPTVGPSAATCLIP